MSQMSDGLKPYPAYKDSGVEWLGKVPEHWEVRRIKSLAGKGHKTFVDGDWIESPHIRAEGIRLIQTGNIGIGQYREKGLRYIDEETFLKLKCTEIMPGDVLICRLGDPVGRACLAPNLGVRMITSVDVCILKLNESAIPAFLVYAMSSREYLEWIGSLVRGSTRDRVSRNMLGRFSLPLPPLPEQTAIVRFLDYADRRIRRVIRARQQQIKLLEEYKQALIHQAVTGQIDVRTGKPYPAYKDSGVKWLGQVPEHWTLLPFKRCFRVSMGPTILASELQDDGKYPVFSATEAEVYFGRICSAKVILCPGDLVVPARGVSIGSVKIVTEPSVCTQTTIYAKRRPSADINSRYVFYFLRGCRQWLFEYDRTAIPQLTTDQVNNNPLLISPLSEQTAIVEYLDAQTTKIDAATGTARREIELLREYRERLIADVVTGKVDVREVAAQLPEEDELASADEIERGEAPDDAAGEAASAEELEA